TRNAHDETDEPSTKRPNRGVDFISNLPNDCLVDIFSRLDHNDIDEVALISKRLGGVSEISRSSTGKLESYSLRIAHKIQSELSIVMDRLDLCCTYHLTSKGTFKKVGRSATMGSFRDAQEPTITEAILAVTTLKRLYFNIIDLHSISIDDDFLHFFEHFCTNHPNNSISITSIRFADAALKQRFFSILLEAKFASIKMENMFDNEKLLEIFLKDYSDSVVLAGFSLIERLKEHSRSNLVRVSRSHVAPLNIPYVHTDNEFVMHISRFGEFEHHGLVINTDWLMPAIANRLRLRKKGEWAFNITRDINKDDIIPVLGTDLGMDCRDGKFIIRICKTFARVQFKSGNRVSQHPLEFHATFFYD
ncbi:hypothetical protein PMAYCL1PPCAC_24710, partial [Pristionchus mayeri]